MKKYLKINWNTDGPNVAVQVIEEYSIKPRSVAALANYALGISEANGGMEVHVDPTGMGGALVDYLVSLGNVVGQSIIETRD